GDAGGHPSPRVGFRALLRRDHARELEASVHHPGRLLGRDHRIPDRGGVGFDEAPLNPVAVVTLPRSSGRYPWVGPNDRQGAAMNIENKTSLITGANRGIGEALVEEALRRGARKVYAGTRSGLRHADGRVTPVTLDVTNGTQIQTAAQAIEELDVLVNNAGIALYDDLSNLEAIEQQLAVNFFGTLKVSHAFLPVLKRSRGAIVNCLSLA